MKQFVFRYACSGSARLPRRQTQSCFPTHTGLRKDWRRRFHQSPSLQVVRPYILADIGEGITECQIISWSVKPGDRVEQFDPICEVQSDKATVEITSRYDGVVKALHYEQDEVAIVGKALLDMDIADDVVEEKTSGQLPVGGVDETFSSLDQDNCHTRDRNAVLPASPVSSGAQTTVTNQREEMEAEPQVLLTPAVRHLLKEAGIVPSQVRGTGKGGRITKDDVHEYLAMKTKAESDQGGPLEAPNGSPKSTERDQVVRMTPVEDQMFKVMTRSLAIPHFLYSHSVDVTSLNQTRTKFKQRAKQVSDNPDRKPISKLSALPIIMKAISRAFLLHPKLNSHLDTTSDPKKPHLIFKASHHFGIAVDTPHGLLVPVVRDVEKHSVLSLAGEIHRLSESAQAGRLTPAEFKDATFTISNIGSIGGDVVNPVIVPPMVGIVALGHACDIPVFETDETGIEKIVKRQRLTMSWSADHRVLDGATVAKAAETVNTLVGEVDTWGLDLS